MFLPVALGLESSLEEVTSTHEGQTDEVDADVDWVSIPRFPVNLFVEKRGVVMS